MSASASQRRLLVELAAGAVVVMTVPVVCEGQPAVAVETHVCETPCPAAVLALSGMGVRLSGCSCGDLRQRTRLRPRDQESLGRSRRTTVVACVGAVRSR